MILRTTIINPKSPRQDDVHDEDSDDVGHSAQGQAGLKSLVKVLVDSMEFTADELESAVHSIPTPSDSLPDSGTSLREAIEVSLCRYIHIAYDILRDIVHDIVHDIVF